MLFIIIFAVLLPVALVFLLALLVNVMRLPVKVLRGKDKGKLPRLILRNLMFLAAAAVLCAGTAAVSQLATGTPGIAGENAIAELRQVELNGRKEWISIRGRDRSTPVLLFLAGGPGGSQMAAARYELAALEDNFVVVNWDQPGSAKSYGAMPIKDITPDVYIDDGVALTEYLCDVFGQERITLVGESWGSALGIFLIDKAPELYSCFIGTGQMISFLDTELTDYDFALQIARERGDTETAEAMEANGKPPYYGNGVTWKMALYLQYLSNYMTRNPEISNGGYNTFRDLLAVEYGILDKINFFRGLTDTLNVVYPQLYEIDLREDFKTLDIPVYFFNGRHDVNAPPQFVEEYVEILDAPHKETVWFEHSGHSPWINEKALFVEEVLRVAGRR